MVIQPIQEVYVSMKSNKKYSNNRGNNNGGRKSSNNQKYNKKESNIISLKLRLEDNISGDILQDVYNLLSSIPFDKISYPVNSMRRYIDDACPANDVRYNSVGYIYSVIEENAEFIFKVALFNSIKDKVLSFKNPYIRPIYTEKNGHLKTIIKFVIDQDTSI